jgi:DNA polymerase-1
MSSHLLAWDGNNVACRALYGFRCTTAEEAAEKAVGMIQRDTRDFSPTHRIVTFDCVGPTWRHALDPEYKASRKRREGPTSHDVAAAMKPPLERAGIPWAQADGMEGDDMLGTLAHRCTAKGTRLTIVSNDRDLLQLVRDGSSVRVECGWDNPVDEAYVRQRLGVSPWQIPDWKALAGDESDNLPRLGAYRETQGGRKFYGFTPKRAAELIATYGSLEDLLKVEAGDSWPTEFAPQERAWITAGRERARLTLTLARLRTDAPVDVDPRTCAVR